MHPTIAIALAVLCTLAAPGSARAQRPVHAPERVPDGVELAIDGRLDEPFWLAAVPIGDLVQVVPVNGGEPTRPTRVRVAYDRDFLYVALECVDEPAQVRARLMGRDAVLDPDDRVEMWFDTFDDQRFAYWFQIGAGGSRGDALIADSGRSFNKSWDGIWYGAAVVGESGWTAEVALPFKTLAFREGHGTWGFNLRRFRKANDEEMRWAGGDVAYRFFDLAIGGALTGMSGMRQGIGLDVVPYAKVSSDEIDGDETTKGDWGGDLRYRITPSLGLQLTYNTDFAETEVDARQINLTRYPLFFPEKRDFFLEEAGLFEFGAPDRRRDTVPYFSRRIGRSQDGDPVPILFGSRLAGRAGDWSLGMLQVTLDEQEGLPERGVGVARVSRNLGNGSALGVIYTGGQPNERGYASTWGADLRLSDPRAFGDGRSGSLWAYSMGTQADGPGGEGQSYGLQADIRTASWEHELTAHHVDDGFDPALGFVRRQGIRQFGWSSSYTWRADDGGVIRRASWRLAPTLTTTDEDAKDSWSVPWRWFELVFDTEDSIQLESRRIFERIDAPFDLRDVPVPAGDYSMTRHSIEIETSERRALRGELSGEIGDFYDGDLLRGGVEATWLPSRYLQLSGGYEEFHVELPAGRFTTRVTEARFDVTPTPWISLRNLLQYDTESKEMTAQSRFRWIFEPGRELFLVGLFGWERPVTDRDSLVPTDREVALKLVYTVRF